MLIWPAPWHDDLRRRLSAATLAVSQLAEARAEGRADPEAQAKVQSELLLLRQRFRGTPYPPTGAAVASAVGLAKLVGRIEWVAGSEMLTGAGHCLGRSAGGGRGDQSGGRNPPSERFTHLRWRRPPRR